MKNKTLQRKTEHCHERQNNTMKNKPLQRKTKHYNEKQNTTTKTTRKIIDGCIQL